MDCSTNIVTANFSGGKREAITAPLWQWDYGQVLCITGIEDLPAAFEVHFSTNKSGGVSTVAVGADGQVTIPNVLLTIGKSLNAWIYLSDAQGEGETEYAITIPIKERPMPETYDAEVTGEFDDVVRQVSEYAETAQTAANSAGASATAAAGSASAAAASASSAAGSAGAAEQARADAVTAKGQAETAAQTATEKAQQTAQNASQAASDAGRAESAAERAESAETGAGAAKTAAEAAAQNAAASAATANEKATLAGQSATAAAGSASAAAQSAASIEGDVQIASQKASEAQTAAGQAVTAKEAAQTAQQGAETAATNAGQSASTATAKAAEAAQSASNAAQGKTDAEAAAARAEQAAASLTVDSALSDSSTNPVQNKVITGEITNVKTALTATTDSFNQSLSDIDTALQAKEVQEDITASLQWVEGKMLDSSGIVVNNSSLSYAVVGFARKGTKYNFYSLRGIGSARAITLITAPGIVNDQFTIISTTPDNAGYFSGDYVVPESGIVVITAHIAGISAVIASLYTLQFQPVASQSDVVSINQYLDYTSPLTNLIDYNDLTAGYINGQGGINTEGSATKERTSQSIPFDISHTYRFVADVPESTGASWLAVGFWSASDVWLGRKTATTTTVDGVSHAELEIAPNNNSNLATVAYMRISWRTYWTQMATANDVTYSGKTIYDRISGKNRAYSADGSIDVGKTGYDITQLGFAPMEETGKTTQGMAVSNGVIFQGYGNGVIDLIDLESGALINSYSANGGHCGSLSFSNTYPDGNTDFPYLYVASFNENKTFVYNVTRESCVLEKTYVIPNSVAGYCQETCVDKVSGVLWCVGHKTTSYEAGEGLIVSAWDLTQATEQNGVFTPSEITHYELPWIAYLQAVQILNGQLFAVFGADGGTQPLLTHIDVAPLGRGWKAILSDFPQSILTAEPEGIDFVFNQNTHKYDAILATRRSVHYYRMEF